MFHSVCCLFHEKRCRLSHREESSGSLTIYVSLTQALFSLQFSQWMDGVRWRHNQIFWHRQVWKRSLLQKPRATILQVVRFSEEGRYSQPKYCYERAIYVVMISFALDFFCFGSICMALCCARFAGANAQLKRRKSGKYKKYLCKLENTDKSIWFSVKPNFKSDIQNIFNRLLHFHARQMDQRLGFSVTEFVLILKFGECEPFFLGLKNTCTWCAWKLRILGKWRIVSRPCCSSANLYLSTILISIRT